jgi:hypothetical protein
LQMMAKKMKDTDTEEGKIWFFFYIPSWFICECFFFIAPNRYNHIDDVIISVLECGFYNASSLKQQSVGRHVTPLGHIIMIPSKLVYFLMLHA